MDAVSDNIDFNVRQTSLDGLVQQALVFQYSEKAKSKEYATIALKKAVEQKHAILEARMMIYTFSFK